MVTFVDRVTLHVASGDGGRGCASVHREKFKPLGGPDGGNGGNGGDIVLVVDPQTTTLLEYHRSPHRKAGNGKPGEGNHRAGSAGATLELSVPDGTVVRTPDGGIAADLVGNGSRYVVAPGGRGGLGNAALASARRKAPGFALLGEPGTALDVTLELKSVADIGLIGYPSAGKSSLVAALSAARPKIADYPFTTLVPNLGVVQAGDVRYTVADVPGLIPGASTGKGLGLEFLRHIERCAALVQVLDCATLEPGRDPISDLEVIEAELAAYPVEPGTLPLTKRPRLVVLHKVDVPEARELADLVRPELEARGLEVFEVSSASHEGLKELSFAMAAIVAAAREIVPVVPRVVIRPVAIDESGFSVRRENTSDGELYRVRGGKPERWVRQTDFANDEAVGYLADRLARLGVEEALVKAGAVAGDAVVIGGEDGVIFDWEPTVLAGGAPAAPRGQDVRLDEPARPTRAVKREQFQNRLSAKRIARAELAAERTALHWVDPSVSEQDADPDDDFDAGQLDAGQFDDDLDALDDAAAPAYHAAPADQDALAAAPARNANPVDPADVTELTEPAGPAQPQRSSDPVDAGAPGRPRSGGSGR